MRITDDTPMLNREASDSGLSHSTSLGKRIGLGALGGLAIGIACELAFSWAHGSSYTAGVPEFIAEFSNANVAVLIERLIYATLGAVLCSTGQLFDSPRLSLASATCTHALIVLAAVLGTAATLKWIPLTVPAIIGFVLLTVVIYVLVWMGVWLSIRSSIVKANRLLTAQS